MSEKGFKLHLSQQFKSGFFGFQPHFPFSHQRLSKDLRKAKRRDAEAPKSFLRKRWKRSSAALLQPQEFSTLKLTECVQPSPIPTPLPSSNCNRGMFQSRCQQNIFYWGSDLFPTLCGFYFIFWGILLLTLLRSNIKIGLGKSNDAVDEKKVWQGPIRQIQLQHPLPSAKVLLQHLSKILRSLFCNNPHFCSHQGRGVFGQVWW